MALADTQTKDRALLAMAEELEADTAAILAANALDLEAARGTHLRGDAGPAGPAARTGSPAWPKGIREVAALP